MMERRRRAHPAALRAGPGRLGRRRRLRDRGPVGRRCTLAPSASRSSRRSGAQVRTLSGGEQKRLVLEALLRGPDEALLLDEPDNYLDVPGKRWLEERLRESPKTVLFVSPRPRAARAYGDDGHHLELGAAGNTVVDARRRLRDVPPGTAGPVRPARGAAPPLGRGARQAQGAGDHVQARRPPTTTGWRPGYQAAVTRLRMFEEAGPPTETPREPERHDAAARRPHRQARRRLRGPRADRADEALRPRGVVRRAGRRAGLERVRQVALPAAAGRGRQRPRRRAPAGRRRTASLPSRTPGVARLGARVRPGWFAQTHEHPELVGRTLLDILWRGDDHRDGHGSRAGVPGPGPLRARARGAEQNFESLSGGQQARLQILLLELSGATLLLLDEPTDNLDLASAEALEEGLAGFEGTVLAVTHDRWFARGVRPLPRARRGRRGLRVRRARSGTRAGSCEPASAAAEAGPPSGCSPGSPSAGCRRPRALGRLHQPRPRNPSPPRRPGSRRRSRTLGPGR